MYGTVLIHHGIKGQKWGERNGPPYPLDEKVAKRIVKSVKKENKNLSAVSNTWSIGKRIKSNEDIKNSYDTNKESLCKLYEDYDKDLSNYREIFRKTYDEILNDCKKNSSKYITEDYKKFVNEYYDESDREDGDPSPYSPHVVAEYYANNDKNVKSFSSKLEISYSKLNNECKNITNRILGDYGNKKMHTGMSGTKEVKEAVSSALQQLSRDDYLLKKNKIIERK